MVGFICTFRDKLSQRGNKIFVQLETFLCYGQRVFCSETWKKLFLQEVQQRWSFLLHFDSNVVLFLGRSQSCQYVDICLLFVINEIISVILRQWRFLR